MADDDEARPTLASVASLTTRQIRELADRVAPTPDLGQMTPQPTLDDLDRQRFTDLSLADVVQILWEARESGDTRRMVDLWLQMLQTDDHLPSVWETRIAPVAAADWEIIPAAGDDDRTAEAVTEALEHVEQLEQTFLSQLNAIGVGYDAAEIIWGRGRIGGVGAWVPRRIVPVHARRFRFALDYELGLYDNRGTAAKLREHGWPVETVTSRAGVLIRLPAGKYVVHMPRVIADYPTGTGLVHSVARWWWVKQTVHKYWLGGAEFAGNARLIGHIPDNAPATVREEMKAGLESLAALGVIVLRGESKVDIVPGAANASGDVWGKLAKRMDAALSKRVLGSTLNVEIGDSGGNRAAAESQGDTTIAPRQKLDGDAMWADWRRDVLAYVVRYNPHIFAIGTPAPHGRFVVDSGETEVVDDVLIASGWCRVDELRRSRNLPELGGEEGAQFVRPSPAAPGGGGAPAPFSARSPAMTTSTTARPWETALRAATATSTPSTKTSGHGH